MGENIDLDTVIDFGEELNNKTRIAIFASGSGTNFEALAKACQSGEVDGEVVLMVCDKPNAGVIERAKKLGIEALVLSPKDFETKQGYEECILERLGELQVELICLAGYMRIITEVLLGAFAERMINIHPSLLPAFKGAKAMEQAFEYGVKYFGATVHYVTEELDSGAIIDQESFRFEGAGGAAVGKKFAELEAKIHEIEYPLYIRSLKMAIEEINS